MQLSFTPDYSIPAIDLDRLRRNLLSDGLTDEQIKTHHMRVVVEVSHHWMMANPRQYIAASIAIAQLEEKYKVAPRTRTLRG